MRRLFNRWFLPVAFVAPLIVLLAFWAAGEESPSSTPPAPTQGPGSIFMPQPGKILSHDSVEPASLSLGNIHARIVPISLDGSSLTPPSDPAELGWWGRMAGAKRGATLLVGHTVSGVGGALGRLGDVPVGTVATVSGIRYRTVSNKPMLKSELAQKASKIFEQDGKPRLVVVTCTGYNVGTGEYSSNEVLTAVPIS